MVRRIPQSALAVALVVLAGGPAMADTKQVEYSPAPVITTHPLSPAQIFIGTGAPGSAGTLVIDAGSQILMLDDAEPESGINVGTGESRTGLLVVTGANSAILNGGATATGLFVGAFGGPGHGVVSIVNGGRIDIDGVRIGADTQATGVINVGAGSSLNFPRTFFDFSSGKTISPFFHVGHNGRGVLNVVEGGKVLMDIPPSPPDDGFSMTLSVARQTTGSGAVNVIGPGSEIKMLGDGVARMNTASPVAAASRI